VLFNPHVSLRLRHIFGCLVFCTPTVTLWAEEPKPIVIAHRGASGYLPEHTEGAKVLAIAQGADYVEQDVVLTKDGIPVVMHDIHLDQVSNVSEIYPDRKRDDGKYYVIDFTWEEIQKLSAMERQSGRSGASNRRFPGGFGQKIMRLEDELRLIQGLNQTLGKDVGIYVELKGPAFHLKETGEPMGDKVLAVLKQFGYESAESKCYIQCFEPDELKRLHQVGTTLKLVQLLGGLPRGESDATKAMAAINEYADGVGPAIPALVTVVDGEVKSSGIVEAAHAAGLQIHPYTIRADQLPPWAKDIEQLHQVLFVELKVDGAFTDFPDLTRQAADK
jgi:glycerophosphoryl diester phosphodiesterase